MDIKSTGSEKHSNFNYLVIIACLLVTCYLTANIMAVKIVNFWGHDWFDAGTITFPLAYMLGDVLTEIWGFKTAKKVIYLTFVCNIILVAATAIGLMLPSPEYAGDMAAAYESIFAFVPRIFGASLVAFLGGEISNAWMMEVIKKHTKGKYLWIRTIGSSAVGYVFDTVLFVILAFGGVVPTKSLITMIVAQYFVKLIIEAVGATPLAYGVIAFLKRKEAECAEQPM